MRALDAFGDAEDARRRAARSGRSLFQGASWMSGSHLVAQAFAYGSLIVLARLVPPASFGTVAVGTTFVWFAVAVVSSGTHGTIVTVPNVTASFLRHSFRRALAISLALSAAIALAAGALTGGFAKGGREIVLVVLALSLPLYAVSLVPTAVLHRLMEFTKLARVTAVANIASASVALILGVAGAGVWALVARQLLWFAFLAVLAAIAVRPYLSRLAAEPRRSAAEPVRDRWFLAFGLTLFLALNLDYLVIGALRNVHTVGLYALAFMIAFAPVQHFSSEVGKVLFAAAAASDVEASGVRTVRATQLMSMLLLPVLPVGIVLAPVVLPAVLGSAWTQMVAPFQILLVVGIGHAITNCIGEALSGVGQIAFRAKVNLAWCAALLVALLVLVRIDGARGAAFAHLVVFVPFVLVFGTIGGRRAGTTPSELWRAVRPALVAVCVQAVVTAGLTLSLRAAGATYAVAAAAGAVGGILVVVSALTRAGRGRSAAALLARVLVEPEAATVRGAAAPGPRR